MCSFRRHARPKILGSHSTKPSAWRKLRRRKQKRCVFFSAFLLVFLLSSRQRESPQEVTPVKEEPSIRLGLNDLSPASLASLDVTIGPAGPSSRPLEGPKLGDTMLGSESVRDSESSSLPPPDSPPLLSLRSAASVARRPSLPRAARPAGRQLKLHSLTFAPKVNLARQPSRKSAGAARLQVRLSMFAVGFELEAFRLLHLFEIIRFKGLLESVRVV